MRHSCKSDSQTLAETLPSFLGWRKLCVLLLPVSLTAPSTCPAKLGIKKRRLLPLLFFAFFPEAKQQREVVFSEAGVEAYAEQHRI